MERRRRAGLRVLVHNRRIRSPALIDSMQRCSFGLRTEAPAEHASTRLYSNEARRNCGGLRRKSGCDFLDTACRDASGAWRALIGVGPSRLCFSFCPARCAKVGRGACAFHHDIEGERGSHQGIVRWIACRWMSEIRRPVLSSYQRRLRSSVTIPSWTISTPDRSRAAASPRFSRHRR
jgi:hypothetical protein